MYCGLNFFATIFVFFTGSGWLFGCLLEENPPIFLYNKDDLLELQHRIYSKDPTFELSLKALIADAERNLHDGPYSVIEKTSLPPSFYKVLQEYAGLQNCP